MYGGRPCTIHAFPKALTTHTTNLRRDGPVTKITDHAVELMARCTRVIEMPRDGCPSKWLSVWVSNMGPLPTNTRRFQAE